jgi:mono/diheme cytochrome c family protein
VKEVKYIWQGCFTILALFISYGIVKFILKTEENSIPFIQPSSYQITKNYQSNGIDGKALFQEKCAACHHPINNATGPALMGAEEKAPNKKILYEWVRNSQKVLASGDKYYNSLYQEYGKTAMSAFSNLTDKEIEAIFLYLRHYKKIAQVVATAYK